jgi:hypothetical protein
MMKAAGLIEETPSVDYQAEADEAIWNRVQGKITPVNCPGSHGLP